jgi:hypothetical protein
MISRATLSGVVAGQQKFRSMLAGNTGFVPTSFDSLATATATGASVTFSSIPAGYASLQIRGVYKDTSTSSGQEAPLYVQFNADGGNNYTQHYLRGNGTAASSVGNASQSWIRIDGAGVVSTTGAYGASIINISDYRLTSKNKTLRAFAGGNGNTTGTNYMVSASSGVWLNTAAITSVTLFAGNGGFASGSTFALYGIRG